MSITITCVCRGISWHPCKAIVDREHAFVPGIERIRKGSAPLTEAQVLSAALCDDCKQRLEERGVRVHRLLPTLEAVRKNTHSTSLRESLEIGVIRQAGHAGRSAQTCEEKALRRRTLAQQNAQFVAAAQRWAFVAQ